jgi:hypothetical protein
MATGHEEQFERLKAITGRSFRTVPASGKVSLVSWSQATETVTPHPKSTGYALLTGAGVLVVDTDTPEAEVWAELTLPATFTVSTAKGSHRYYSVPFPTRNSSQHSRSALHEGTDVRGDGGYVIGPGSLHPSGVRYVIARPMPIAPLPRQFHDLVRAPEATAQSAENAHPVVTPPVFSNARRRDNRVCGFGEDPRVKPRTRELLRDTSDGRDFRLARVLMSLMRSGLTDEECVLQISQSALGSKVREMEETASSGYLQAKIRFTRDHVTRNPSERFTAGMWRQRASGTKMPTGQRKTVDAIAMIATKANATKLVLGAMTVAEHSAQTRQAARSNINKLVFSGWLRRNTKTGVQARGLAHSYTLTIPASADSSAKLAVVDAGSDSWRHNCKAHWYELYAALEAQRGTVALLAQVIDKSLPTVRRQLVEMEAVGLTRKTGKIWSLTADAEILVQTLAVGTKAEGARTRQKQHHEELRTARADELRRYQQEADDGAGRELTNEEIEVAMKPVEFDRVQYANTLARYRELRQQLGLAA